MAILPGIATVPTAQPGPRLPALQAPKNTAGQGLEVVGAAVTDYGDKLAKAEERVRTREDTLARVRASGAASQSIEDELARIETEDDLSDPESLQRFGNFLKQTKSDILSRHKGSEDSRARLESALEEKTNEARSALAGKSIKAQRSAIAGQFGKDLNRLTATVTDSPSRLSEMFSALDDRIDDLAPGLSNEEEMKFREQGRQEIALSAVESFVNRGDARKARELLDEFPGAKELLTSAQWRTLDGRISSVEQAETKGIREAQQEIQKTETFLGRKMTLAERVKKAGVAPAEGKPTLAGKIQEYEAVFGPADIGVKKQIAAEYFGLDAADPKTDAGKYIADSEMIDRQYGPDSPQKKAFEEMSKPGADVTAESAVRKEYTSLSKDFIQLRDAFGKIKSGEGDATGASDMSLIFGFMKILDPGSTVREGEYANAQQTTGVPQKVMNAYNKAIDGTFLNTEQRAQFVDQAAKLFGSQLKSQIALEGQYKRIAKDSGLIADRVVPDFITTYRDLNLADGKDVAKDAGTPSYDLNGNRIQPAAEATAAPGGEGIVIEGGVDLSAVPDEELLNMLGIAR